LPGDEPLPILTTKLVKNMQPTSNIFVGIDVSKAELVIAYPQDGKWLKSKIANKTNEISGWLRQLDLHKH
jgi:hypothetical protein